MSLLTSSLLLCLVAIRAGTADEIAAPENRVKAAFLYNFAKLTEWPTNAFASPEAPFTIGVLGTDPFGKALEETMKGRKVHGHPIQIARFERRWDSTNCHLLFVSASQKGDLKLVFLWVRDHPILTVADMKGFASDGGCIGLAKSGENIVFEINPEAAQKSRLTLSSKLLRLGTIVTPVRALALPPGPAGVAGLSTESNSTPRSPHAPAP